MTTEPELELSPPQPGEAPMRQLAPFESFRDKLEALKATAIALTVTDASQIAEMKLARATRLQLKEIRCSVETRRKELVSDGKKALAKIDSDAKAIKDWCEAQETRLLECEQFAEREQARLEDERRTVRTAELGPFVTGVIAWDLGKLTEAEYAQVLNDSKELHALRLERERKDREAAEAVAKAEADRIEAQRVENERLRKEAVKREAAIKKEREATAAIARKEREKAEAERSRLATELEKSRREAAHAAGLALEARRAVEKAAADEMAEKERIAAEQRKAEWEAASAPDREKLLVLARTIRELPLPPYSTDQASSTWEEVKAQITKFAAWVESMAKKL